MSHPLVTQLRFARGEFSRCLDGVSAADGRLRLGPLNSLGWMVGHLANQEQFYWCIVAQGQIIVPGLNELAGTGKAATTPPLAEMWDAWRAITAAADPFLDSLTSAQLGQYMTLDERTMHESTGTMLQRNIYHYWFHTGEAHAVRQQLGHVDLPQFVGDMSTAVYHPE